MGNCCCADKHSRPPTTESERRTGDGDRRHGGLVRIPGYPDVMGQPVPRGQQFNADRDGSSTTVDNFQACGNYQQY